MVAHTAWHWVLLLVIFEQQTFVDPILTLPYTGGLPPAVVRQHYMIPTSGRNRLGQGTVGWPAMVSTSSSVGNLSGIARDVWTLLPNANSHRNWSCRLLVQHINHPPIAMGLQRIWIYILRPYTVLQKHFLLSLHQLGISILSHPRSHELQHFLLAVFSA